MLTSKIPLLVSSTLCFWVGLTPPQKVTKDDIHLKPTLTEELLSFFAGRTTLVFRVLFLAGASTEIGAILAKRYDPTHAPRVLQAVLNTLRNLKDTPMTPTFVLGASLVTFGGVFRWFCYRAMGRHFTYLITKRKDHKLITSGPYAWVRHPSYTGSVSLFVGSLAMTFGNQSFFRASGVAELPLVKPMWLGWISVMAFATTALCRRMQLEDEMMRSSFGEEWERWASKVKYRLIPGIY